MAIQKSKPDKCILITFNDDSTFECSIVKVTPIEAIGAFRYLERHQIMNIATSDIETSAKKHKKSNK